MLSMSAHYWSTIPTTSVYVEAALTVVVLGLLVRMRYLDKARRTFRIVAEHANDGLLLQRIDGTILWCNDAYTRISGRPRSFWVGRKPQKWVYPEELCPSDEEIEAFRYDIHDESFKNYSRYLNQRADGTLFWNEFSLSAVELGGKDPLVVLICRDISEQVAREEALTAARDDLERAVNYDALTGLANRRKLMAYLDASLKAAADSDLRVGLIHIDLDKFKDINDTHGHHAGDAVLVRAAEILNDSIQDGDLAARIGGDEFIVMRPRLERIAELEEIGKRILEQIHVPFAWEKKILHFGASLGAAASTPQLRDSEELIQKADFALYDVKARGRGDYAFYDKELQKQHIVQKGMSEDLARVIRDDKLEFYYQPILDYGASRIIGIETLVRWNHPKRGMISPVEFIALAEDIGLLEDIDLSAMMAAMDAGRLLHDRGHDSIYVSFNASFQTLANANLVDSLRFAADSRTMPYDKVVVEVLETVLLGEDATDTDVAHQIEALGHAGFATTLDDFGIGYAGLSHLAQLKVKGIKIDRSLIRTILTDPTSDVIVRAILNLAGDLGLKVVAEGVETLPIAQKLQNYGCSRMQGYGIARPMPLPQLSDWLDQFEGNRNTNALFAAADLTPDQKTGTHT